MLKLTNFFLGRYSSTRQFYFILLLLSAIGFVFSLSFLINDRMNLRSKIFDDVKSHNERIEQKFSDSLLYTKLIMSYVGRQIANYDKKHDLNFIRNLLVSYHIPENGLMSWSIFSWADENHQLVVSSGIGVLREKKDLSMRDYMIQSRQHPDNIEIGAPVYGVLSRLWSIPIGYGVLDTHRQYIGSVVTGIIVENLRSQIESLITNRHIFFAIVDGKNQVITMSEALESERNKEFLNKFLEKINESGSQNMQYKYGYYQKLPGYEHGVITIYDREFLFETLNDKLMSLLSVIFFFMILIAFISYSFHRTVTESIAQLSSYIDKMPHPDLERKIRKFEIAEIDQLAQKLRQLDSTISRNKTKHD